jgi:two-component system sensor histidine kinase QseC
MKSVATSLQARTTALVVALAAGVWIAATAAMWRDSRHELTELLDAHLSQAASFLISRQAGEGEALEHGRHPAPHPYAPRVAFEIFHRHESIARSSDAPSAPSTASDTLTDGFGTVSVAGVPWRTFAVTDADRDVRVVVAERMSARDEIAAAVLRNALWPMLLALPLLAVTTAWAIRRGLRPLKQLGRSLAARAPDELDAVAIDPAPAEVRPLVDALNLLLSRMRDLLEAERRFTADAAHELRTPVAAIRAQAQAALTVPGDEARRHALDATVAGCDRAARLIDQLLLLARLESGSRPEFVTVDLARQARQVLADAAPAALAKGQRLEFHVRGACSLQGSSMLVSAMARNLVDNAIRYSPHEAIIEVSASLDDGRAMLAVEDSGPGMPEAGLRRLGDRFFRGGGSEASGSGLGWSIIGRIAELHRSEVTIDRSPSLGGLRVRVRFVRP